MLRFLVVLLYFASTAHAAMAREPAPAVGFSILKTSAVSVQEGLLRPDGSMFKKIDSNFSAFLIKHGEHYFLFDTGMGKSLPQQYAADMPWWARPFFSYQLPIRPARAQLDQAGFAPLQQVVLSHSHWDHTGGVLDFPEARIAVAGDELALIRRPRAGPGGTWPSQVQGATIEWSAIAFEAKPYRGYARSFDLYGDAKAVLVEMPGHTAGSVGLFLTVDSGTVYFFIGDVAWTVDAVRAGKPKFWAAAWLVDASSEGTQASVAQVRALMQQDPALVVVPAHDSAVQDGLGYFPKWVR